MSFDPSEIQSTYGVGVHALSCLVFGEAGAGKTSLAATTGAIAKTIVLSAEAGLLPLRRHKIKYIEITGLAKLLDVIEWLERLGAKGQLAGRWIILDSISEIAERLLRELKTRPTKGGGPPDGRAAYGEVTDTVLDVVKRCKHLPCNTVFLAKQDRIEDGDRRLVYGPMMPGKQLAKAMPYEFDLVMAMRVDLVDGEKRHWLQVLPDGRYGVKDRSGVLDGAEEADLGAIAAKIVASAPIDEPKPDPKHEPPADAAPDSTTAPEAAEPPAE